MPKTPSGFHGRSPDLVNRLLMETKGPILRLTVDIHIICNLYICIYITYIYTYICMYIIFIYIRYDVVLHASGREYKTLSPRL